jgi:hypothetical protein
MYDRPDSADVTRRDDMPDCGLDRFSTLPIGKIQPHGQPCEIKTVRAAYGSSPSEGPAKRPGVMVVADGMGMEAHLSRFGASRDLKN